MSTVKELLEVSSYSISFEDISGFFELFGIESEDQELTKTQSENVETSLELLDNGFTEPSIEACFKLNIPLTSFRDAFMGEFYTDKDFVENFEYFGFLDELPENLSYYIDFDKVTETLMLDFIEYNGFYFSNAY